eukprot:2111378-Pyramimonas_sp.AAC.1
MPCRGHAGRIRNHAFFGETRYVCGLLGKPSSRSSMFWLAQMHGCFLWAGFNNGRRARPLGHTG